MATTGDGDSARHPGADAGVSAEAGGTGGGRPRPLRQDAETRVVAATRWLVATLGLLAFATSASAECAWVVWGPSGESGFVARAGYKTWSDCEDARRAMLGVYGGDPTRGVCLPDTVDPRGPK